MALEWSVLKTRVWTGAYLARPGGRLRRIDGFRAAFCQEPGYPETMYTAFPVRKHHILDARFTAPPGAFRRHLNTRMHAASSLRYEHNRRET